MLMNENATGISLALLLTTVVVGLPLKIHAVAIHVLCICAVIGCLLPRVNDSLKTILYSVGKWRRHEIPDYKEKGNYLAIDCEMVGTGRNGKQSALARVSIVDWDLQVVFDTYVKVKDRVTDYRTSVSGIRAKHLKGPNAMNFRECRKHVEDLLTDKIVVGHGLENDFDALCLILPEDRIRDTSLYRPLQRFHNDKWCARKLRELVRDYVGMDDFQKGEHDSIHDARAVMQLFHIFHKKWEDGNVSISG